MADITLRRKTGATTYEALNPTTTWTQVENKPTTFTPTSHTHGDISNTGTITATAVTPANTDYILISDTSASGAIERGIQIGTGTTTFLRNDGTWATPADVDTNTYVSSASFNTGTGVLTLTKNDASIVTVDLDGKYAESSHTHSEYLKYNPDGDGIAIAYDDSNPTINGQAVGGGHVFGADGSSTNGYLNAKVLLANGITNSVSGYYVGAMTPSTGGTSTQVVDGSGNWVGNAIPAAKLGTHEHSAADITSGTLAVGRGGTGTTTAPTVGGVAYGNYGSGSITYSSGPTGTGQVMTSTYNGLFYHPTWSSVLDSSSNASLGTSQSLVTERDIYYGLVAVNGSSQTRATTIYAPTTAGSSYQTLRSTGTGAPVWVEALEYIGVTANVAVNTYGTVSFTSGMRNFYIEVQQDGSTGLYQIAKFNITMEDTYSLTTSSRYYRATWFNGSSALTITFQYYYTGTTLYIRHTGPTVTLAYRVYNIK